MRIRGKKCSSELGVIMQKCHNAKNIIGLKKRDDLDMCEIQRHTLRGIPTIIKVTCFCVY